jgi:hypothetical protein
MAGETILPAAPIATQANTRIIAAPFQFVLSGTENLRIRSANSLAGVTVTIQGRLLTAAGDIQPFTYLHTPHTDRSLAQQDFGLGGGTLLTLLVFAVSGAPVRGQTFIQLSIIQGLGGGTVVLGTLLQGYVTSFQQLSWPGSPIDDSLAGRGYQHVVVIADPPAGSAVSASVPAGARWRLQAFTGVLTTSAVAGQRKMFLAIATGGIGTAFYPGNATVPASLLCQFTWASVGFGSTIVNFANTSEMMSSTMGNENYLLAGDVVSIGSFDFNPADQFSQMRLVIEEWLELN